ncbi:MAG TPA: NADH-quinone oxidoreductase subunit NuoH [Bryobacteraceae bacterium]|nr:NADH-quinone oxidoreductase subunit NuoH [Bryobacteraceae bacterium]
MNFFIVSLIKSALVAFVLLTALAYIQWVERKVLAHIQLRVGPRRVGPHGLLQPLADVIKLLTKEDMLPSHVNKFFYFLAPFIAVMFALISIAVIPFGTEVKIGSFSTPMQLTDLNIGVLFILGLSGMGVYGVALAGWASNNKYALIGGLRSSAQMISYELPMAMAIAAPLLMLNSLSFRELVDGQGGFFLGFIPRWSVFQGPFPQIISFLIFLVAAFAETNRVPFDLPEAENELVAGFHVEYGSMKFAAFFMAEYANMVTVSCVAALLFLGGWQPLWPTQYGSGFVPTIIFGIAGLICFSHALNPARPFDRITLPVFGVVFLGIAGIFLIPIAATILLPLFWFLAKVGIILFIYIWIRGTLPRFRYDQLMNFAWTVLFPVAIINLFVTALAVALTSK